LPSGLGLLDGVGGEREPDRVADPLVEEGADSRHRLDEPAGRRSRLGDAEMERVVDGLGEEAVGGHHGGNVGVLDRDLDVGEVDVLEVADLLQRRLDQGLGDRRPVTLEQVLVEGTGVDAHPDRDAPLTRLAGHGLDVLLLADVAGVEAQPLHPRLHRRQGELVLEVDVGDDRHRRAGDDLGQALGGFDVVAGDADDVGSGPAQGVDLGEGAVDVGGLGGGHRLDRDRGAAAHGDIADVDLSGFLAGDHKRQW
jgi:hypothetical protein